jgi:hypothetical protein
MFIPYICKKPRIDMFVSLIKPWIYISIFLLLTTACNRQMHSRGARGDVITSSADYTRQVSLVNVPVEISVQAIESRLNSSVQGLLYEDNSLENNGNDNVMAKVWKRDNIRIKPEGDQFALTVPLKVWAKGRLNLNQFGMNLSEFRETNFTLDVHLVTKLGLDQNWQLQTQTAVNGFNWISKPVIKVAMFEVSLAPFLEGVVRQQQEIISRQIDQQLKKEIRLGNYVQQAWHLVQQPLKISEEHNTWFRMMPSEIAMTPLTGDKGMIRTTIGIKGFAESTTGDRPAPAASSAPLPPLQTAEQLSDSSTVRLSSTIPLQYVRQMIADQVVNKTYSFQNGKREVQVTDVEVYGRGENLVIKAGLTGSVNGTVHLTGQPYFDPEGQILGIQHLDYDLNTKNTLVKTASWLGKGRFTRQLEESFRIPVGEQIAEARQRLEANLSNISPARGVVLNGTIADLSPEAVYVTPDSLIAVIRATGRFGVKLEGM